MELTKEQTFKMFINAAKQESFDNKYIYTTKYLWWCLHCLKPLYLSYKRYGINAIFCKQCYPSALNHPTIVQYQYVRILKEKQLKLIENQIYLSTKEPDL